MSEEQPQFTLGDQVVLRIAEQLTIDEELEDFGDWLRSVSQYWPERGEDEREAGSRQP